MKIAFIIVRILMGLLFLMASIPVLFHLPMPEPKLEGNAKLFMDGITATTYFLPFLKLTEFVCGLAFLAGRFVPLAAVVLFPITLNIFLYHLFVLPSALPMAIAILVANLFLAYACRKHYGPLLQAKRIP
ncbi:MAG TPA: DoxX family membrane protein [Verrucomicrobiae bacterium]|nr:DoxX family membrane protein [Verrucomicrobiae bacterium]